MTDSPTETPSAAPGRHRIERVRHELKRRHLVATRVRHVTPGMVRVTLSGEDLDGFVSAGFDDHIKIFLPVDAPEGEPATVGRDYTPRSYRPAARELDIDFALHEAGPATSWAVSAAPGSTLEIGGPRGSFVLSDDFDWYLLVGDETALPAIGRRLEELRPGVPVLVIAEVAGPEEEQAFETATELSVSWLHRGSRPAGSTELLDDALRGLKLPAGEGFAWAAGEADTVKRLRRILVEQHGQPGTWIKAAGYWHRGATGVHEPIAD